MPQHDTIEVMERPQPAQDLAVSEERQPETLLRALVIAASDPSFDVEKLKTLRELHKEAVQDQRRAAFNEAMAGCQEDIGKSIIKTNKYNDQTKSNYADLSAINEIIVPIYTKHGFSVSYGTADPPDDKHYRVTAILAHTAGFERPYAVDVPVDIAGPQGTKNKTATHAFGSTMSYARRYLTLLMFNVGIKNEDKDGNQPSDMITEEQVTELKKIVKDGGLNEAEVLNYFKLEKFDDMYAKAFAKAKAILQQRAKKSAKNE